MATITGTNGNDIIDEIADGGDINENDAIVALDGDDLITVYENFDNVTPITTVFDTVDGGDGVDTLRLALRNPFNFNYTGTSGSISSAAWQLRFDSIERFILQVERGGAVTLGDGDDVVTVATSQATTINTGGGADFASFGTGAHTVNLGAGTDRLVVDYGFTFGGVIMGQPLSGSLATGYSGQFAIAGQGISVTFAEADNITITSGAGSDTLVTGDGDDVISSGASNDMLTVGKGNDLVNGGTEIDSLSIDLSDETEGVTINLLLAGGQQTGGTGAILNVESFAGAVIGSAFDDTLIEGNHARNAQFVTGAGDDLVQVSGGADTANLGDGDDRLAVDYGYTFGSVIMGQPLTGTLAAGYSGQFLIGGQGISVSFAETENFTITSGAGADTLVTGDGNDVISSGAANDTLTVGRGNDSIDGGTGIDALSIDLSDETQGVAINLLLAGAQQTGGTGSITNIESFAGAVTGSAFNDVLIEGNHARNAQFATGAGNDLVQVSGGIDTANLGAGDDRLVVDYGTTNGAVNMAVQPLSGSLATGYSGQFQIAGQGISATFSETENFTVTTGLGGDTIVTGDGDDVASSGAGIDMLTVGKGDDSVDGGTGVDSLSIDLSDETQGVAINLLLAGAQQSGGSGSIANIESFAGAVNGSAFDDVLIEGNHARNAQFATGAGNDLVQVSGGIDTANLGAGDDRLVVDYGTTNGAVNMAVQPLSGSLATGYSGQFQIAGQGISATFSETENFTVTTGLGGDTIVTGGGDDVVSSGAGIDMLTVGKGDDSVDGGTGVDSLSIDLSDETQGVGINLLLAGAQQSGGSGSIANIESFVGAVTGSAFDDVLIEGNHARNAQFATGAGNDLVQVSGGADTANLGAGNDRLVIDYAYTFGTVTLSSLSGTLATGYSGTIQISGQGISVAFSATENFTILSGAGGDTLVTGEGADVIDGGGGNDRLFGQGGNDTLSGGIGNDQAFGGTGDDIVNGGAGNDILQGDAGNDTVNGDGGNDNVNGGAGDDILDGGAGDDSIVGGDGNDSLDAGIGGGNNILKGGTGDDLYFVYNATDPVIERAGEGFDTIATDVTTYTLPANVEAIRYFGFDSARLTGNGEDNLFLIDFFSSVPSVVIFGLGGNDTISATTGADQLFGGDGIDSISAGDGNDLVLGDAGDDFLFGDGGTDNLQGGAGNDRVNGGTGNDNVNGGEGDDRLFGDAGNDSLQGGAGNDELDGGTGNDIMVGSDGDDIFFVDSASDTVIEQAGLPAGTADRVRTTLANYTLGANIEVFQYSGTSTINAVGNASDNVFFADAASSAVFSGLAGDDTLNGSTGNDTFFGGIGNDTLEGLAGNDVLLGEDGDDTIDGGLGNDNLQGGVGIDTLTGGAGTDNIIGQDGNDTIDGGDDNDSLSGNAGDDIVNGDGGNDLVFGNDGADTLNGGAGDDRLAGGADNDTLNGGDGFDILNGEAGDDALDGGAGDDRLFDGLGIDSLTGGLGADDFRFTSSGNADGDTVTDFDSGVDKLNFQIFDEDLGTAGVQNPGFSFIGAAAFDNDGTAKLRFENGLLEGDVDGDGVADFTIMIGGEAPVITDFLL